MSLPGPRARTALLTALALVCFATNSLLCRAALGRGRAGPAAFTAVRLASGAAALALLAGLAERGAGRRSGRRSGPGRAGSWTGAAALAAYAVAFSFAYRTLSAGTGALVLFGAVQATMLAIGIGRGSRPSPVQWAGLGVALSGLVVLTRPGLAVPEPAGAALMAIAGAAWGVYSALGLGAGRPLRATASNFARTLPVAAVLGLGAATVSSAGPATRTGLALAVLSGALASGVGYALWYAALERLAATTAAAVQLAVPVLTAAGAVLFLGEPVRARLAGAGVLVLGGLAAVVLAGRRRG